MNSTSSDSVDYYPFYTPSNVAPILFAVLFGLSMMLHVYQMLIYKGLRCTSWFLYWGSQLFVVGFGLRAGSAKDPTDLGILITSLCFLFLAPPVYAAANYFTFGRLLYYVPYLSPIHPGRVFSTFMGLDMIVGVFSGTGAGRIALMKDPTQQNIGYGLIKASILLQVFLNCCFFSLEILIHLRCTKSGVATPKLRKIIYLLYISTSLLLVRNIYRAVDVFQGYSGYLERHEIYLYVFDALLMLINTVMFNAFHPSKYLPVSNKTYLARDGQTELEGPGWLDQRNFFATILDPFDLVGLITGRDRKTAFWNNDAQINAEPPAEPPSETTTKAT